MKKGARKITLESLSKQISESNTNLNVKIDSEIEKLAGIMKGSVEDLESRMNDRSDKLDRRLDKQFFEIHDELSGLKNQFGNIENLYAKDREEHKFFRNAIIGR